MSESSGLMTSLRRLVGTLVGIVQTRIELISVEIEDQVLRMWHLILLAGAILLFSGLALIFFSAWIVVLFWENHPAAALGVVTAVYLAAALLTWQIFRARRRARPRLFQASLAELARDREHLAPPP
jgi:uncharacterized membrane protein YqjE